MISWWTPTRSAPRVPSPLRLWRRRRSSAAAQGSEASDISISPEASLPAPRRMKVFTVELALRGLSVHVTGTAESEWHACSSIMRQWPDARFVAVREGT